MFFLLANPDIFMDFFALVEQLKMSGQWLFVSGI